MGVKIDAIYEGQLGCQATHEPSGMRLSTDAPVDNGGQGQSFSPTDLVATALGTCVMTIMALVAQRHGIELRGMTANVVKEMVQVPQRRIGSLKTVITVPPGACVDLEMRKRLQTAADLCPVHQSLHPDIDAPIEIIWQ